MKHSLYFKSNFLVVLSLRKVTSIVPSWGYLKDKVHVKQANYDSRADMNLSLR